MHTHPGYPTGAMGMIWVVSSSPLQLGLKCWHWNVHICSTHVQCHCGNRSSMYHPNVVIFSFFHRLLIRRAVMGTPSHMIDEQACQYIVELPHVLQIELEAANIGFRCTIHLNNLVIRHPLVYSCSHFLIYVMRQISIV